MVIGEKLKGIGEVVIRVNNMDLVKDFYKNKLGLRILKEIKGYTFFKISEGFSGHHQVLALFDKNITTAFGETRNEINHDKSSLHHLAFEIDKNDYDETINLLRKQNIDFVTEVFEWVKWKSIFVKDPELNIIEFVCYDSTI